MSYITFIANHSAFCHVQSFFLNNSINFSTQGIYRHARIGFDDVRLDYAYADIQLHSQINSVTGIRLGRMKIPLGLYNETRDIAITRPSIYLPQSLYLDLTARDSILSGDGLLAYLNFMLPNADLVLEASYGKIDNTNSNAFLARGETGLDTDLGYGYGLRAFYDHHLTGIALGFTAFYTDEFVSEGQPFGPAINVRAEQKLLGYIFSFKYSGQFWSFASEYGRTTRELLTGDIQLNNLSISASNYSEANAFSNNAESVHFNLARRISGKWSVYGLFDWNVFNAPRQARDYGIGLEWRPTINTLLRMEYHYVDGTNWINLDENRQRPLSVYWDILGLSFSFRF